MLIGYRKQIFAGLFAGRRSVGIQIRRRSKKINPDPCLRRDDLREVLKTRRAFYAGTYSQVFSRMKEEGDEVNTISLVITRGMRNLATSKGSAPYTGTWPILMED